MSINNKPGFVSPVGTKMATGTLNPQVSAHENLNRTGKMLKIFKPSIHNAVNTGTNSAKIWLSLYFVGRVNLAR